MIVKVCGVNTSENLAAIDGLSPEMIGLNFYPKSKRYIDQSGMYKNTLSKVKAKKAGVFVQSELQHVRQMISQYQLDFVQLHGDEDDLYCKEIQKSAKVIKVFRIDESFDFKSTQAFAFVDYFLLDTYTNAYGGSGKRFDWDQLIHYKGDTPFLLSGGIGTEDAKVIRNLKHPLLSGVDINSKFELEPGVKDVDLVKRFMKELKD